MGAYRYGADSGITCIFIKKRAFAQVVVGYADSYNISVLNRINF